MTFKVGDIISPDETVKWGGTPLLIWNEMRIVKYNPVTKKAAVFTKSGRLISNFNLDQITGCPFKVVNLPEYDAVLCLSKPRKEMLLSILKTYPRNMREPFETNGEFQEHLAELDKLIKEIEIS